MLSRINDSSPNHGQLKRKNSGLSTSLFVLFLSQISLSGNRERDFAEGRMRHHRGGNNPTMSKTNFRFRSSWHRIVVIPYFLRFSIRTRFVGESSNIIRRRAAVTMTSPSSSKNPFQILPANFHQARLSPCIRWGTCGIVLTA